MSISSLSATFTGATLRTAVNDIIAAIDADGWLRTDSFAGIGIGAKFNAAVDAAMAAREVTASTYWPDIQGIRITPGSYDLDETLDISGVSNLRVQGSGVRIRQTGAAPCLKLTAASKCHIDGITFDLRDNNVASECILIAGSSSWNTFADIKIQANSSLATFAGVRMKQGDATGYADDNRDKGNFWNTFDRVWMRKLTGTDANGIAIGFDLQGCQNATRILNCSLNNITSAGVLVQNQNGSTASGISNDVQVLLTAFEGFTGGVGVKWTSTDSGDFMSGGAVAFCRFESGTTAVESAMTATTSQPVLLVGNTLISSVTNYIVDAQAQKLSFNSLDQSITPDTVQPRFVGRRGLFVGSTSSSGYPSLAVWAKQVSDGGGALVLQRSDGTKDGGLSQRAGGGMDIDGGAAGIVRVAGVRGLSGGATHAANFRGTATNPASGTTIAVTLPNAEADASYYVCCFGDTDRKYWVTSKTTTGFTINTDTAFSGTGTTVWMLIR